MFTIESYNVVVVPHGLEIHQQWQVTVDTQGGGGEQRSLQAVSLALPQRALRRPRCVRVLVRQRVKESLDSRRCL